MKKRKFRRFAALAMAVSLTAGSILSQSGLSANAGETGATTIAFPGAEGGGMYASGGRGYDVYIVTNLLDYAIGETPIEGSLRYGIDNAGTGRTIVFNVGGVISLKQTLSFSGKKNITIAGQTAPGDGITFSGYETNISGSENLIIRYVRFRTGASNVYSGGDSMDALWGRDNKTFIIDHCSFSWNTDECLSTYRGADGTVQWCVITESLTVSGHSKGRHGYGGIFGGDNVVFQYNLIANHTSRNPRIGGGTMTDPTKVYSMATLQVSNNVLYNWGYNTCYGGGYAQTNYINNYLKAGLGTRDNVANQVIDAGEKTKVGGFYVNGNYLAGNTEVSANNSLGLKFSGDATGASATTISSIPYTSAGFDKISLVSAQACYQLVLNRAGATFPKRDAIDARVIAETANDTGRFINTEDEVGGYPTVASSRDTGFDTDMDGIPDYWETAKGLNAADPSDGKAISTDGYSNLEHYINSLVDGVQKTDYVAPNPTVSITPANNSQYAVGQNVEVTATAKANNGGTIAKVDFYNGIELVGSDSTAPFSYTYSGLADGTYNITARAYDNAGNETQSSVSKLHMNSTAGTGIWTSKDIGTPDVAGSASLTDNVLTVKGSGKLGKSEGSVTGGAGSDATKDSFQYTYKTMTGDGELITKLDSATTVDNHVFTGIMFRDTLDANAKTAAVGLSLVKINSKTTWSTYMVSRNTTGGAINEISETIDTKTAANAAGISIVTDLSFKTGKTFNGTWFKMTRSGDTFTSYSSQDGTLWTEVGSRTVDMGDTIYIGFAVDSNKVANDLNNLSTAKFSNISLNQAFISVEYDLTNITTSGATSVTPGSSLTAVLTAETGYDLPDSVTATVDGSTVSCTYDKTTGTVVVSNVTGKVKINAAGVKQAAVSDYTPVEVDPDGLLTVSAAGSVMKLEQSATSGSMPQNTGVAGTNVSYLVFPATTEVETLSLNLKITKYSIFGANGKNTGLFVGAFQTDKNYLFSTLGFRGYDGTTGTDSLSGYWIKTTGKAGNGSPKYTVAVGDEYKVTFVKNDAGFLATFENMTNPLQVTATGDKTYSSSKQFKWSELALTSADAVRFGLGLSGVSADITNLKLTDKSGNVLYNQADHYKDAGTAPKVTAVNAPVVSTDRTSVSLSWAGTGATGDGKYLVEVSKDNGSTFTKLGNTAETTYTYAPKTSGSYIFRVTGICGSSSTDGVLSAVADFMLPMASPVIDAVSGNAKNTVSWTAVTEATTYTIYRSTTRNGDYSSVGTTSDLQFTDDTAVNEIPYFYKVSASNTGNSSNPSAPVTIMATAGHTGAYMFGSQAAKISVSEKTNDTVLSGNASFKASADRAGTFTVSVNGTTVDTKAVSADEGLTENITLINGRNDVVIYFTDSNGTKTYKNLNFVRLSKVDVIVDPAYAGTSEIEGVPTFTTVAAAIASIPVGNTAAKIIYVKNGTYHEKIDINTPYISLIGQDSEKTAICFDAAAGTVIPGTTGTYGTSGSSTVTVNASAVGFSAENITIANTFDYVNSTIEGKQAVAFYDKADMSILTNVRMTGWQDTVCADGNARQLYSKCYIEGNVDFIFGNAQAVFSDCDIVSNAGGYVTAASTETIKSTGYVFINSRLLAKDSTVKDDTVYLGRPWRSNACVMYIGCFMDSHIQSDKGYTNMSENSYKNAQFYEYASYGPGFAINSNRPQLSADQVAKLTVNGIFAREAGAGFTYATAWTALESYAALSSSYVAPAVVVPEDDKIVSTGDTEVIISDDKDLVPSGAKLDVKEIKNGEAFESAEHIIKNSSNTFEQYSVYEIDLKSQSDVIISKLNGNVTVSIPLPSGFGKGENVSVFRVEEDGSLTRLNTKIQDGKCIFETNHFSTYIVAKVTENAPAADPGTTVVPDSTIITDATINTEQTVTADVSVSALSNPATADLTPLVAYIIIAMLSLGLLVLSYRKRKIRV